MTGEEQPVRLVLRGAEAPVCDGDVCYLPSSTADADSEATPATDPPPQRIDDLV